LVFEEVCADLEAEGYAVQPFLLPACGVGAPHRRDRVWFVAYANDNGTKRTSRRHESAIGEERIQERDEVQQSDKPNIVRQFSSNTASELFKRNESGKRRAEGEQNVQQENWPTNPKQSGTMGKDGNASDTERLRLEHGTESKSPCASQREARKHPARHFASEGWARFPTFPPVCGGDDGLPRVLDGITFPKWRRESIKAYGNAIVPQVALQIFKAIQQYENGTKL